MDESIYLSSSSLIKRSLNIVTFPIALLIIGGISYTPGYMNAFIVISLILDRSLFLKPNFLMMRLQYLLLLTMKKTKFLSFKVH